MIVGIDEAGRGPWAGPVVFGAVVLGDATIEGLTDSKKLSKKKREALNQMILSRAKAVGLGWASAAEIDERGLGQALQLACRRALEQVRVPYNQIIIDGTVNFLAGTGKGPYVTTMAKADALVPSVSAASVVAKVARDNYMAAQDELYPGYGFKTHVGYGTAAHRQAIERLGITNLHRRSFAPIAAYLGLPQAVSPSLASVSTTKTVGDAAEDQAARYLEARGFHIMARNWKTKACEIDIIARKKDEIYFVEVKYRRLDDQGGGLAAITPKKLNQMQRAAHLWFQRYGEKTGYLSAIEVSGEDYQITHFLEQV